MSSVGKFDGINVSLRVPFGPYVHLHLFVFMSNLPLNLCSELKEWIFKARENACLMTQRDGASDNLRAVI